MSILKLSEGQCQESWFAWSSIEQLGQRPAGPLHQVHVHSLAHFISSSYNLKQVIKLLGLLLWKQNCRIEILPELFWRTVFKFTNPHNIIQVWCLLQWIPALQQPPVHILSCLNSRFHHPRLCRMRDFRMNHGSHSSSSFIFLIRLVIHQIYLFIFLICSLINLFLPQF